MLTVKNYKPKPMPAPGRVPGRRGDAFYKWVSSEQKRYFAHMAKVSYTVADLAALGILTKKPNIENFKNGDVALKNPTGDTVLGAFFQNGKWIPISGHCQVGIPEIEDKETMLSFSLGGGRVSSVVYMRSHDDRSYSVYEDTTIHKNQAKNKEWRRDNVDKAPESYYNVLHYSYYDGEFYNIEISDEIRKLVSLKNAHIIGFSMRIDTFLCEIYDKNEELLASVPLNVTPHANFNEIRFLAKSFHAAKIQQIGANVEFKCSSGKNVKPARIKTIKNEIGILMSLRF